MSAAKKKKKMLKVTLVKSPIGCSRRQKRTIQALGLRKVSQSVSKQDTPALQGMLTQVSHLITIEDVS